MQHALLGLAIAFILAIAAALAAPAVVDWNDWRAEFERHASTLTGAPVRIRGRIEATLLPTPAFVFRDVQVGNPESGSGARIGEVQGVLSLGALLRGHLEAETFALIDPDMRIADTGQGSILQAARTAAAAAGVVTLARIGIARGSLTIDRAGGPLVLDDIYADGDMRSRQGPIKFDGVFRHEGRRFGLKISTGQFSADGTGRVRATLDHAGVGHSFDADGQIFLSGSAPRFEGKLIATHRPPVTAAGGTPWQLTANTRASEARVELDALQLSFGKDAAATDLAGKLEFQPWRGGKIDGNLSARRLDLDLAAGSDASKGLPAAIAPLREIVALLDGLLGIERHFGRERDSAVQWGPRILDLDLLLYGDAVIDEPGLRVPHPYLHERAFALLPLAQIGPDLQVPGLDTVAALLRSVDTKGCASLPADA